MSFESEPVPPPETPNAAPQLSDGTEPWWTAATRSDEEPEAPEWRNTDGTENDGEPKLKGNELLPDDSDEESAETQRWLDLEEKGIGWKLHLNFDRQDPETTGLVESLLSELQESGEIAQWKVGDAGDDSPGKEGTVYVGPADKALGVAELVDKRLGSVLKEPEGDVLAHDVPIVGKVHGRFDVQRDSDDDFRQWGADGLPFLKTDIRLYGGGADQAQSIQNAREVLEARYGEYFTGTLSDTPDTETAT